MTSIVEMTPDLKEALAKHPDRVHEEPKSATVADLNLRPEPVRDVADEAKPILDAHGNDRSRALVVSQAEVEFVEADDRSLADIESVLATALHHERNNVVEIGKLLIAAKRKVAHGEWLPWLSQHFGKSERTARNYMSAAEWVAFKSATVADLKIRPSALYWLSQKKVVGSSFEYQSNGIRLSECEKETGDRIFALAKTKWVDRDDCIETFDSVARGVVARATAAKVKAEKAAGTYVSKADAKAKKYADAKAERIAAAQAARAEARAAHEARTEGMIGPPEMTGPAVPKRLQKLYARRNVLLTVVNTIINDEKWIDGLVGAVETERLYRAAAILLDLVDRQKAGLVMTLHDGALGRDRTDLVARQVQS
jgi:hypothetical protein